MAVKVTDFPFKGRGVRSLSGKGSNAPKRKGNLRTVDQHVKSVRAAAKTKAAPKLSGGGMLHDSQGPHPVKHMEGAVSKGDYAKPAMAAAKMK